jgi:hypothetical protein
VDKITAFEVADARQALKLDGAKFITQYPRNPNALTVKFNIARAFYDDGEFERSSQLFTAFAMEYPTHKDSPVGGKLALDSLRQLNDFKGIEETTRKFLSNGQLPPAFLAEVRKFQSESKGEALGELALQSSAETGDVVEGLLKVASENKGGDIAEKALYGAFTAAREKKDYAKEREIGAKLLTDYPKTAYTSDVLASIARHTAEAGRFPRRRSGTSSSASAWGRTPPPTTGGWPPAGSGWCSTTTRARRRTSRPRPTSAATAAARRWPCWPRPS